MIKRFRGLLLILFLSIFSLPGSAQILDDFFIQQDFYYSNNEVNILRLGTEAGMGYTYVDYSVFMNLGLFIDSDRISAVERLFIGGAVAAKIPLNNVGFRFPVLVGATSALSSDGGRFLTISPGAQFYVGKFEQKFGLGYQYFYGPNADIDRFNTGSVSAFIQWKIFQ